MLTAKRVQGFSGFLLGIILAAAWGAAAACAVYFFTSFGNGLAFGDKLRLGGEVGGIVGASLFLIHQPPLAAIFLALRRRAPWSNILFWPLLLAYHLAAFPGVLIGRATKLIAWSGDAPAPTAPAAPSAPAAVAVRKGPAPSLKDACPYEGRVVAIYEVEFRGTGWTPEETIFEVHQDWRCSSEKLRYWGWVDPDGNVHEGTGDPADSKRDVPVIATLRGGGCYVGSKKIGTLRGV